MCGRFSLATDIEELQAEFPFIDEGFDDVVLKPRYNIAPSQICPVIVNDEGAIRLQNFVWGLVPHWAKDKSIGYRMINARSETVEEKPSYKKPKMPRACRRFLRMEKRGKREKKTLQIHDEGQKAICIRRFVGKMGQGCGALVHFHHNHMRR